MIDVELLGQVRARCADGLATLRPQHQLLLARLAYECGAPVRQPELMKALWGQPHGQDNGLKRTASELRKMLESIAPGEDAVSYSENGSYRLRLKPEQTDFSRFRTKSGEAYRGTGQRDVRLMHDALREWGQGSTGLFGGDPLSGLNGTWAAETRLALRREHRNAVVWCLRRELDDGHPELVLAECERRAVVDRVVMAPRGRRPQVALLDQEFVELWFYAAREAGESARGDQVIERARDAAARAGVSLGFSPEQLASQVRSESRRSTSATSHRRSASVSEPSGVINNYAGAKVIGQVGVANQPITITVGAEFLADEPDTADGADAPDADSTAQQGA